MSSLIRRGKNYMIQFLDVHRKRQTLSLGAITSKSAQLIHVKTDAILDSQKANRSLDSDVQLWLEGIGDDLYAKMVRASLVKQRNITKLEVFLDGYIEGRSDTKESTRFNLVCCKNRIVEFFGADRCIGDITKGDADRFHVWLRGKCGIGTIGRTVGRAKQFFKAAVKDGLLKTSPLEDLKGSTARDESRVAFITREMTTAVLDACPSIEWRLIVALARYGGLRCPSELELLKWTDILWDKSRFWVHTPKKIRLDTNKGAIRLVPIYPELRPLLEECFGMAEEGEAKVLPMILADSNLRTTFNKIVKRAGLKPWPKPFVNMRSSRQTELSNDFPGHQVCDWMGNSLRVADKHYLQTTEEHFARATALQTGPAGAAQSAEHMPDHRRQNEKGILNFQGKVVHDPSSTLTDVQESSPTRERTFRETRAA